MVEKESVSADDLSVLKDSKTKMGILSMRAEKAILEAQLAEAEHKNNILSIHVKYTIRGNESFDEKSGLIMRKYEAVEEKIEEVKDEEASRTE